MAFTSTFWELCYGDHLDFPRSLLWGSRGYIQMVCYGAHLGFTSKHLGNKLQFFRPFVMGITCASLTVCYGDNLDLFDSLLWGSPEDFSLLLLWGSPENFSIALLWRPLGQFSALDSLQQLNLMQGELFQK